MIVDKEDAKVFAFWMLLALACGWLFGWIHAHNTVRKECERLGSFYVGSKTFKCTEIQEGGKA